MDLFAKSIAKVMQENILLRTELKRVQKANDELSRHCRTKRQLQQRETLSLQDIQELETQNDVQGQIFKEEAKADEEKTCEGGCQNNPDSVKSRKRETNFNAKY